MRQSKISGLLMRPVCAVLFGAVCAGLVSCPKPQPTPTTLYYSIVALSGEKGEAKAVNNHGEVVGDVYPEYGVTRPMLWRINGAVAALDLGDLGGGTADARDINDFTRVTGTSKPVWDDSQWEAFLWTEEDGMVSIGTLGGGDISSGDAINYQGAIVGTARTDAGIHYAFLWDEAEGMRVVPGADQFSKAFGINNVGQVVGVSDTQWLFSLEGNARRWNPNGDSLQILNTLGGEMATAEAINIYGQVTGFAQTPDGYHAYKWVPGELMAKLPDKGVATQQGLYAWPSSINTAGDVVGRVYSAPQESVAALWRDGVLYDLNNHIKPGLWHRLSSASDINEKGCICGNGYREDEGTLLPFLLIPSVVKAIVMPNGPVMGGQPVVATLTLSSEAPMDMPVELALEGLTNAARLPDPVLVVSEGQLQAAIEITTFAVTTTQRGTLTATFGGWTVSTELTVQDR